jgi:predicted glycosyltransferase involved in capsule biosynthesis
VYTDKASTDRINSSGEVSDPVFERVVGYYEGGSLACTKDAYWKVGGFNEDFWGYGCEDCDFYERMSGGSKYLDNRTYNLLHLHHGRSEGWYQHHDQNKAIHDKLKELTIRQRIELQISQVTGMVNC